MGAAGRGVSQGCAALTASPGDRVALYARLALRETPSGPELPYVLFSDNYPNLLPGQSVNATAALTSTAAAPHGQSLLVCAEAWNAPEKCARSERPSIKMDDEAFPPHAEVATLDSDDLRLVRRKSWV